MADLAAKIFKYRSYSPIPFLIIMILYRNPNIWSIILGLAIAIFGELIRIWAVSWAGSETRTTGSVGGTFLVISGPFAYLRNPLYLGNILIYTGLGIMSFALFPFLQIVGLLFFIIQYRIIIIEEENYLAITYGKDYEDYCRNVPRFLPRLTPYKNNRITQPDFSWNDGLKSEKRSLQAFGFVSLTLILLWLIQRM